MKASLAVLLVLLQLTALPVYAAFYQWTDEKGVVHLTDDRDKIPRKYRGRVKELQLPENAAPAPAPAPAPAAAPQPAPQPSEQLSRPGGQDQSWWRGRFAALRGELKSLEDALPQKQEKLSELRRERRIYTRARDRVAVNAMNAEIAADEVRISELRRQLEELEQEAARAGVPAEWRR